MVNLKKTKINFNKKNNKSINLLIKYLPCFFKGEILIVLGILVLSLAYYKVSSYDSYLYYFTFLFVALGAFITGRATYNRLGGRGIISGSLGSLPIAIINIAIIFSFCFKTTSWFILLILPISILSGAIGGILASNSKKRY